MQLLLLTAVVSALLPLGVDLISQSVSFTPLMGASNGRTNLPVELSRLDRGALFCIPVEAKVKLRGSIDFGCRLRYY
ncbi:hypothetical protein [Desulfitobacterium chlororespirans]|uniref:hypothetical protein n=1 Tax=Desulfitobacterium chlororespirans TaxID=51616 RepID=UPI001A9A5FCC|nr:hypothetical protein [Desulfitobacterium chlororespirans]